MTLDLFTISASYPAQGKTDTSREAARKVAKGREGIWAEIIHCLRMYGPRTGSELANRLNRDLLYIRPRLVELQDSGTVVKTAERRKNAKGNSEIVWSIA